LFVKSLIFTDKALPVIHLDRLLTLLLASLTNNRTGWKGLQETNALAYLAFPSVTKERKKF
jgi:hypothetical protein